MAQLVVQDETLLSGLPSFAAAAVGGDQAVNDGTVVFWVHNQSGAPITCNVLEGRFCNFNHAHVNQSFVVSAGALFKTTQFDPRRWNDESGNLKITYSSATNVVVAAVAQKQKYRS